MKKVKLIYNPYSGENVVLSKLHNIISIHQQVGLTIVPYRIVKECSIEEAFEDITPSEYEYILVAGGDGTVDSVVNTMAKKGISLPMGILPVGTANDFSKFLGIPFDVEEACKQIINSTVTSVDLGKINDKYFVKGLEELPNFRPLKVNIKSDEMNFEGNMYLMLVFNGQTAGNFNLASRSDATDGLLDVIVFKAVQVYELLPLFIKVLKGEHLDSDKVIYFKTNHLHVECNEDIVTDIDGEKGPDFPLDIKCIKGGVKILGANIAK